MSNLIYCTVPCNLASRILDFEYLFLGSRCEIRARAYDCQWAAAMAMGIGEGMDETEFWRSLSEIPLVIGTVKERV